MPTESTPTDLDDKLVYESDAQAVMQHFLTGAPLDREVERRVRQRSERRTEELRRKSGTLEVAVDLVREGRDET